MNRRTIGASVAKALAAGAMVTGLMAVVAASSASANPTNNMYVAVSGRDGGNNCTTKTPATARCQTIQHALAQAAASGVPQTINVAKGHYGSALDAITTLVSTPGTGNNGDAIVGGGIRTVIAPPASSFVSLGGPTPVAPVVLNVPGVSVQNLEIDASSETLPSCSVGPDAGVDMGSAGVSSSGVAVTGASCGVGTFVGGGTAAVINGSTPQLTKCNTVTKTAIPAGSNSAFPVNLKKRPCVQFGSGPSPLLIAGVGTGNYSATYPGSGKTISFSGTAPAGGIPAGSSVNLAPLRPAYGGAGIECGAGSCTVSGGSVTGDGPTDLSATGEIGIVGAPSSTLQVGGCAAATNCSAITSPSVGAGVTVSGNNNTTPAAGSPTPGIGVDLGTPAAGVASATLADNTISGNDAGVVIPQASSGAVKVGGSLGAPNQSLSNTISGGNEEVVLGTPTTILKTALAGGTGSISVNDNSITGAAQVGVVFEVANGVTVDGNNIANNGLGVDLTVSSANTIGASTTTNGLSDGNSGANLGFGIVASGLTTPTNLDGPFPNNGSPNSIANNSVSGGVASDIDYTGWDVAASPGGIGTGNLSLATALGPVGTSYTSINIDATTAETIAAGEVLGLANGDLVVNTGGAAVSIPAGNLAGGTPVTVSILTQPYTVLPVSGGIHGTSAAGSAVTSNPNTNASPANSWTANSTCVGGTVHAGANGPGAPFNEGFYGCP